MTNFIVCLYNLVSFWLIQLWHGLRSIWKHVPQSISAAFRARRKFNYCQSSRFRIITLSIVFTVTVTTPILIVFFTNSKISIAPARLCPTNKKWKANDKTSRCFLATSFGEEFEGRGGSYRDAERQCLSYGGWIGTIKSKEEDQLVLKMLEEELKTDGDPLRCWMGFREVIDKRQMIEIPEGKRHALWVWADEPGISLSEIHYFNSNWNHSDTTLLYPITRCGTISTDGWHADQCWDLIESDPKIIPINLPCFICVANMYNARDSYDVAKAIMTKSKELANDRELLLQRFDKEYILSANRILRLPCPLVDDQVYNSSRVYRMDVPIDYIEYWQETGDDIEPPDWSETIRVDEYQIMDESERREYWKQLSRILETKISYGTIYQPIPSFYSLPKIHPTYYDNGQHYLGSVSYIGLPRVSYEYLSMIYPSPHDGFLRIYEPIIHPLENHELFRDLPNNTIAVFGFDHYPIIRATVPLPTDLKGYLLPIPYRKGRIERQFPEFVGDVMSFFHQIKREEHEVELGQDEKKVGKLGQDGMGDDQWNNKQHIVEVSITPTQRLIQQRRNETNPVLRDGPYPGRRGGRVSDRLRERRERFSGDVNLNEYKSFFNIKDRDEEMFRYADTIKDEVEKIADVEMKKMESEIKDLEAQIQQDAAFEESEKEIELKNLQKHIIHECINHHNSIIIMNELIDGSMIKESLLLNKMESSNDDQFNLEKIDLNIIDDCEDDLEDQRWLTLLLELEDEELFLNDVLIENDDRNIEGAYDQLFEEGKIQRQSESRNYLLILIPLCILAILISGGLYLWYKVFYQRGKRETRLTHLEEQKKGWDVNDGEIRKEMPRLLMSNQLEREKGKLKSGDQSMRIYGIRDDNEVQIYRKENWENNWDKEEYVLDCEGGEKGYRFKGTKERNESNEEFKINKENEEKNNDNYLANFKRLGELDKTVIDKDISIVDSEIETVVNKTNERLNISRSSKQPRRGLSLKRMSGGRGRKPRRRNDHSTKERPMKNFNDGVKNNYDGLKSLGKYETDRIEDCDVWNDNSKTLKQRTGQTSLKTSFQDVNGEAHLFDKSVDEKEKDLFYNTIGGNSSSHNIQSLSQLSSQSLSQLSSQSLSQSSSSSIDTPSYQHNHYHHHHHFHYNHLPPKSRSSSDSLSSTAHLYNVQLQEPPIGRSLPHAIRQLNESTMMLLNNELLSPSIKDNSSMDTLMKKKRMTNMLPSLRFHQNELLTSPPNRTINFVPQLNSTWILPAVPTKRISKDLSSIGG